MWKCPYLSYFLNIWSNNYWDIKNISKFPSFSKSQTKICFFSFVCQWIVSFNKFLYLLLKLLLFKLLCTWTVFILSNLAPKLSSCPRLSQKTPEWDTSVPLVIGQHMEAFWRTMKNLYIKCPCAKSLTC